MLIDPDFKIRHVAEQDLDTFLPLLIDLERRGAYLPCRLTSPHLLRQQFKENGFSTEALERLVLVDGEDRIIGTLWHSSAVPYFNAREIGYTLLDEVQRNRGIMSRAVTLLSRHLFDSRLINRLEIRMDARNLASEKVAIKCGYKKEGVSRGANFVYGQHVDMCLYALLRDELSA